MSIKNNKIVRANAGRKFMRTLVIIWSGLSICLFLYLFHYPLVDKTGSAVDAYKVAGFEYHGIK